MRTHNNSLVKEIEHPVGLVFVVVVVDDDGVELGYVGEGMEDVLVFQVYFEYVFHHQLR